VVAGALVGARRHDVGLVLTGPESEVRAALRAVDSAGVEVVVRDAPETIGMDEHPAQAVRRKPRSSIGVALGAVKSGEAAAMVSAGNSGAVMASALLVIGRIPGIDRPAIAAPLPSRRGRTLVLDLGAVTDPKPHHLVQFARMGAVYAREVMGIEHPTVGLLSNGEEATKGNLLVLEAHPLLAAAEGIDFRGNVEGKDLPSGVVDVVVTDGFTGNVALKVAEGVAGFVGETIRAEIVGTPLRRLAGAVLRPAFREARAKLDYAETGGAALLGVDGMVVIAHGRSNETAIANAVGVAVRGARGDVAAEIAAALRSPASGLGQ
jgi:glycerol-3-phosphate acyltransferase PlsX